MESLGNRIMLSLLDEGKCTGYDQCWERAEEEAYAQGYKQGMEVASERGYSGEAAQAFAEGYAASQIEYTVHDFFEAYMPTIDILADAYMEDEYDKYLAQWEEDTEEI